MRKLILILIVALLPGAAAAGERERAVYAAQLQIEFEKSGFHADFTTTGPDNSILVVRYVMISRQFVFQVLRGAEFLAATKAHGFREVRFTDGLAEASITLTPPLR